MQGLMVGQRLLVLGAQGGEVEEGGWQWRGCCAAPGEVGEFEAGEFVGGLERGVDRVGLNEFGVPRLRGCFGGGHVDPGRVGVGWKLFFFLGCSGGCSGSGWSAWSWWRAIRSTV
ncbi:hypothetical protein AN480_29405 [Mycobacterium intracellulare subsp. chimaera]|nr:hypothetical protein AN480_29405 [Mycobacterium intracellulare subsp. chimaera]